MSEEKLDEFLPAQPELRRQASAVQIAEWLSNPPGAGIPQYQEQLAKSCVKQSYLSSSVLNQLTAYLDYIMTSKPLDDCSAGVDSILVKAIRSAYPDITSDDDAKKAVCILTNGVMFERVKTVRNNLGWRAKYCDCMLRELADENAAGQIMALLADFIDSSGQCTSRQRFTFDLVVDAYRGLHNDEIYAFNAGSGLIAPTAEIGDEAKSEDHERILKEWVAKFMEQYKIKAYKAAFIEPAKLYLASIGSLNYHTVEFHAANLYGVLLLATVGVQVPIPDINDASVTVGLANFLSAGSDFLKAVEQFKLPEYFGRGYNSIPLAKEIISSKRIASTHNYKFIFALRGSAKENVPKATKEATEDQKNDYAKYLSNFFYFFETAVFVERFLNFAQQERSRELQHMFDQMKNMIREKYQESELKEDSTGRLSHFKEALDTEDYRMWIWDVMDGTINIKRGALLLNYLDVVKESALTTLIL
jgi:hypothetical protein